MFTAFVLLCAQSHCFAIGGPAWPTYEQCVADFMQSGQISIQVRYPNYTVLQVECYEWKEKVES